MWGCCQVKLLSLFHFLGKGKHLKFAFGEEVSKQWNYLPYEPINSIPKVTREAVTAEDGVDTVQVFQLFYKGCVPPSCNEWAMIDKTTYTCTTLSQGLNMWVRLYNQTTEVAAEEKELLHLIWWLIVNWWLTKNQANQ